MIRVVVIGQGQVASNFVVGLERLKKGEIEPYGVPLADMDLGYNFNDIKIVGSYDVDAGKVGRSLYDVAKMYFNEEIIPEELKDIYVRKGISLGKLQDMPFDIVSLDENNGSVSDVIDLLYEEWCRLKPDVVVDLTTTQYGIVFRDFKKLEETVLKNNRELLTPSQVYCYSLIKYVENVRSAAYVNCIPVPIANDPAIVGKMMEAGGLVLGDDGATGATPLTADILRHMADRNRKVLCVAQFNIGGNLDFLALLNKERNRAKEFTKSSIVKDILGYDAPHYIRPTGYLEPLGDKKFVAMHLIYKSFNGAEDEIIVNMRINDSPALAGYVVDLVRLSKLALDNEIYGTVYEINAFYMKRPGPLGSKSISKILARRLLGEWVGKAARKPVKAYEII